MSTLVFKPTGKRQYTAILVSLLFAAIVMWFGVFKLHIYDAAGIKQKIGISILSLDWIIISILSFIILKSYWSNHKLPKYKSLPSILTSINLLAVVLIIIGLLIVLGTIIWYIFLWSVFGNFTF